MITNIILSLSEAAQTTKRASDRVLLMEAARQLAQVRHDMLVASDNHMAFVKYAERAAAKLGYDSGYSDGFFRGVSTALDPMEPEHTATVTVWQDARKSERLGRSQVI